ncbi:MAG: shikimate dehydrogenase [Propionibacteriaceae bacterium]|nr:shikimate dehydrogenase [Propionibacteriaceae bacterium]
MTEGARRCAVIGSPIAHSLSPVLHRAAYQWLGLDWQYDRHEVTVAALPAFVAGLDASWRGLSCTMPLKEAIVELGVPDATVEDLGVANTVIFDGAPGDRVSTRIRNTDVEGLLVILSAAKDLSSDQAIGPTGRPSGQEILRCAQDDREGAQDGRGGALVLGTGATATSAVYALSRVGVTDVQVAGRNRTALARLAEKAERWGMTVTAQTLDGPWAPAGLAISTVPAAVAAGLADRVTTAAAAVVDVLYDPWPTPLTAAAQAAGRPTFTGRDLLAHQAVGQLQLMTGRTVPADVLLAALAAER